MDNYQYCVDWVVSEGGAPRVLDFGCGAGAIVSGLRRRGVEAYGCDVFYEGGDYSGNVSGEMFSSGLIRRISDGRIPFADSHFDVVINNQVLEHVENLDAVLSEMARVLKPGGKLLSLFPDKSVWREGHCGIPFLHWFPQGSRPRIYYAALLRSLGFGKHKDGKPILKWSRDFCEWIDKWTHYRGLRAIQESYAKHFEPLCELESHYFDCRCDRGYLAVLRLLPAGAKSLIVRKLASMVFVVRRIR